MIQDLRSTALLLAEGIGRAIFTAKRIRDIAHYREVCCLCLLVEAAHVNINYLLEIAALAFELISIRIQEADSQSAGKTHAAIICSGAADCNRNLCEACVQRCFDQLAGAISRCVERVSQFLRYHGKSGSLGHLQNSLFLAQLSVVCIGLLHQRAVHVCVDFDALSRKDHRVSRALAAVRDRNSDRLARPEHLVGCLREKLNSLLTGDRSLERIRCK